MMNSVVLILLIVNSVSVVLGTDVPTYGGFTADHRLFETDIFAKINADGSITKEETIEILGQDSIGSLIGNPSNGEILMTLQNVRNNKMTLNILKKSESGSRWHSKKVADFGYNLWDPPIRWIANTTYLGLSVGYLGIPGTDIFVFDSATGVQTKVAANVSDMAGAVVDFASRKFWVLQNINTNNSHNQFLLSWSFIYQNAKISSFAQLPTILIVPNIGIPTQFHHVISLVPPKSVNGPLRCILAEELEANYAVGDIDSLGNVTLVSTFVGSDEFGFTSLQRRSDDTWAATTEGFSIFIFDDEDLSISSTVSFTHGNVCTGKFGSEGCAARTFAFL